MFRHWLDAVSGDACDAPCVPDEDAVVDSDLAPSDVEGVDGRVEVDDEELLRRIWDDLSDKQLRRVWRESGGDEDASASER